MTFEALIAVSKKRAKTYNLAFSLTTPVSRTIGFGVSTFANKNLFRYGLSENDVNLIPTEGTTAGGFTNYTVSVPMGVTKVYFRFPEPAVKNGSFVEMTPSNFITEVVYWDNFTLQNLRLYNQTAMIKVPDTLWEECRMLTSMFRGCSNFNQFLSYNVSRITDIGFMFADAVKYSQDLSGMIFKSTTTRNLYDSNTPLWTAAKKPKFTGT